jgi:uncharacterized protein YkwD
MIDRAMSPLSAPMPESRLRCADRIRPLLGAAVLALSLPTLAAERPASASEPEGFVQHLAQRINDYRRQQGLPPLTLSDELMQLAAEHSLEMAERRQLSHQGFRERRRRTDSPICVENVAHNFPTPATVLEGWRRSPEHHRNLLEPKVSRMGLAGTARYVTFFACG